MMAMNVWKRLQTALAVKTQHALENLEDPREALDYACTRQREQLTQVARGLADVMTCQAQLEWQADRLRRQAPQWAETARLAMLAGHEDQARLALQRKQTVQAVLTRVEQHLAEVTEEAQKLRQAEQLCSLRLTARGILRGIIIVRQKGLAPDCQSRCHLQGIGERQVIACA